MGFAAARSAIRSAAWLTVMTCAALPAWASRAGPEAPVSPACWAAGLSLVAPGQAAPADPQTVDGRARSLLRAGRTETAADLLADAIARSPTDAALHARYGYLMRYAGALDRSMAAYERAMELDPSPTNRIGALGQLAKVHIYRGAYGRALVTFGAIRALRVQTGTTLREKTAFYEGLALLYLGDVASARDRFGEAVTLSPGTLWAAFAQGYDALAAGEAQRLQRLADCLQTADVADGERRYRLVHLYAGLGETDRALGHLEAAEAAGNFNAPYAAGDPLLDPLRASERFQAILARIQARHATFLERHIATDNVEGNGQ